MCLMTKNNKTVYFIKDSLRIMLVKSLRVSQKKIDSFSRSKKKKITLKEKPIYETFVKLGTKICV